MLKFKGIIMWYFLLSLFFILFFLLYKKLFCKKYYIITYTQEPELKAKIVERTESRDSKVINYYYSVYN